ncbi:MAG: DUF6212 domain-containing protein, partial [Pseudomonadota bacterium]
MSTEKSPTSPEQTPDARASFRPLVVLGDGLKAPPPALSSLQFLSLSDWMAALVRPVTDGQPPRALYTGPTLIGLVLTEGDAAALAANAPAAALVAALEAPVKLCPPDIAPAALSDLCVGLLAQIADRYRKSAAEERAATAALRNQHRDMQAQFSHAEEFVYHALAPRYIRTEEFAPADGVLALDEAGGALIQRLPFSTRSMAAVDLFIRVVPETPGTLTVTIARDVGPDISEPMTLALEGVTPGWVRFMLPSVLAGEQEDALARVAYRGQGAVSL